MAFTFNASAYDRGANAVQGYYNKARQEEQDARQRVSDDRVSLEFEQRQADRARMEDAYQLQGGESDEKNDSHYANSANEFLGNFGLNAPEKKEAAAPEVKPATQANNPVKNNAVGGLLPAPASQSAPSTAPPPAIGNYDPIIADLQKKIAVIKSAPRTAAGLETLMRLESGIKDVQLTNAVAQVGARVAGISDPAQRAVVVDNLFGKVMGMDAVANPDGTVSVSMGDKTATIHPSNLSYAAMGAYMMKHNPEKGYAMLSKASGDVAQMMRDRNTEVARYASTNNHAVQVSNAGQAAMQRALGRGSAGSSGSEKRVAEADTSLADRSVSALRTALKAAGSAATQTLGVGDYPAMELKVRHLAEIAEANGKQVRPEMLARAVADSQSGTVKPKPEINPRTGQIDLAIGYGREGSVTFDQNIDPERDLLGDEDKAAVASSFKALMAGGEFGVGGAPVVYKIEGNGGDAKIVPQSMGSQAGDIQRLIRYAAHFETKDGAYRRALDDFAQEQVTLQMAGKVAQMRANGASQQQLTQEAASAKQRIAAEKARIGGLVSLSRRFGDKGYNPATAGKDGSGIFSVNKDWSPTSSSDSAGNFSQIGFVK